MRFLSVCSGIEAASVAWERLGWRPVAYSEIDPFPCHVLAHRQRAAQPMFMPDPDAVPTIEADGKPRAAAKIAKDRRARRAAIKAVSRLPPNLIPNFGDLEAFRSWPDAAVDLLVGGTPCQSFSVAGLRKGLDDPRGNLALVYLAVANRYRPQWVVWENVPGVLSSNGGRDFGAFLGGLGQLGYGWAYRVLDAQFIRTRGLPRAVPQRRRRVFVVGYLGDWRPAAAVFFDSQSMRGDPPPRREAGQGVAGIVGGGPDGGRISGNVSSKWAKGSGGPAGDEAYNLIAFDTTQITHPDNRTSPRPDGPCHPLSAAAHPPAVAFNARQDPDVFVERTGPLDTDGTTQAVAVDWAVRRLMPLECERLQGFPDGYTQVPYRGKPAVDGPRYKALGNSMAVNAMQWIGERVAFVEGIHEDQREAAASGRWTT